MKLFNNSKSLLSENKMSWNYVTYYVQ